MSYFSFFQNNYIQAQNETLDELKLRAEYRNHFYEQHNYMIQQVLSSDLLEYMDGADISRMRMISVDWFVYQFLNRMNLVYNQAPVYKFEEGVKETEKERFNRLMSEVDIFSFNQDTYNRMRLHNTVLAHVKFHERLDRIYLENVYDPSTTRVFGYPDFGFEPLIVAYETLRGENPIWVVWDRETGENYYASEEPKLDRAGNLVVGKKETIGTVQYWPWVVYRYRKQSDFWGHGMDSLVELARALNVLLTVTDDDTIQETLRILLLPFRPAGELGEKGQIKLGMRHPIMPADNLGDATIDGKVIQAELYNEEVVKWIQNLTDMVSSMHAIPNVIKSQLEQDLSGVALKLKNEPVLQQWAKDIERVRQADRELLSGIIEVNNTYRPKNAIDPGIVEKMDIDYREPNIVTDEKMEYELARMQWKDGTGSPVEWVMRKNPEMTADEAETYIRDNKKLWDDLYAVDIEITTDPEADSE